MAAGEGNKKFWRTFSTGRNRVNKQLHHDVSEMRFDIKHAHQAVSVLINALHEAVLAHAPATKHAADLTAVAVKKGLYVWRAPTHTAAAYCREWWRT